MKSLSMLKDTSERELQGLVQMVGSFVNGQSANDERMMVEVVSKINQSKSLLSFFFPTSLDKEKDIMTLDILRKMHHSQMQLLDIYINLKIELAKKSADTILIAVSMDLQGKLVEFATEKFDIVSKSVGKSKSSFLERMAQQNMEIESYKYDQDLYEQAKESRKMEMSVYFKFVNGLLGDLLIALTNKVPTS